MVTRVLLFINIAVHFVVFFSYSKEESIYSIYEVFGLVPSTFLEGYFWQPITSMFLHSYGFPLHLAFNMIGLWSFGNSLEKQISSTRFFWLYAISGLVASLFVIFIPYYFGLDEAMVRPTVGASGALIGILGALAVIYPKSKILFIVFPMSVRTAAFILGIGSFLMIIFSNNSYLSHSGHLGGLIGGILYAKFVILSELKKGMVIHQKSSPESLFNHVLGLIKKDWYVKMINFLKSGLKFNDTKSNIEYLNKLKGSQFYTKKEDNLDFPNRRDIKTIKELKDMKDTSSEKKGSSIKPSIKDSTSKTNGSRLFYDPDKEIFVYEEDK